MVLLLNGTLAGIPTELPVLPAEGVKDEVPKRLSNHLQAIQQLSAGPEEKEKPGSDTESSEDELNTEQVASNTWNIFSCVMEGSPQL